MAGKIRIKYFGNSAFQLTTEKGKKFLIDPCLTGFQGHGVTKFKPGDIEPVDAIFVTHAGADHLGDTYELAVRMKCPVMCEPAVLWYLRMKGISADLAKSAPWGADGEVAGIKFKSVESHHISFLNQPFMIPVTGHANGYIIYSESGRGVYHPGDTSIFGDLKMYAELYHPEIALLGIDGFPGHWGELNAKEAAIIARWMKLKAIIPHHYQPGSPSVNELIKALKSESPETQAVILGHGEEVEL